MGMRPRRSARIFVSSLSTQMTSLPFSAKQAPATSPSSRVEAVFAGDGWPQPRTVATFDDLLAGLTEVADGGWAATPPPAERPGVAPLDGHAAWRFAQQMRELGLR